MTSIRQEQQKQQAHIVWILAFLMLIGLLSFSSISLAEEEKWIKKPDMLFKRTHLATSAVNVKGKIYIYAIGGSNNHALSIVEAYDPEADKWTTKAKMPTPRWGLSASLVNGKIYAIGGQEVSPGPSLSTVEEYDPVIDKWTKKADMLTARVFLSTSVVNGKIYAIGGSSGGASAFLSTLEEYDPETDTWTKKADMPTARGQLSTSEVDGKIYAIGGAGWGGNWIMQLSTVEEYDPVTDTWIKKADMPSPRSSLSTSELKGKIYAIGGWFGFNVAIRHSTVEAYDPKTDTWTRKADMPAPRIGLSTSVIYGKIYAIGGSSNSVLSTVEAYDPGLGVETKGKLPISWGKIKAKY